MNAAALTGAPRPAAQAFSRNEFRQAEGDGQTLLELHVRMTQWHGASQTRQAMSRHLAVLEEVGLLRCEWQWRSKFHFLELEPLRRASAIWLGAYLKKPDRKGSMSHAHRAHERARR